MEKDDDASFRREILHGLTIPKIVAHCSSTILEEFQNRPLSLDLNSVRELSQTKLSNARLQDLGLGVELEVGVGEDLRRHGFIMTGQKNLSSCLFDGRASVEHNGVAHAIDVAVGHDFTIELDFHRIPRTPGLADDLVRIAFGVAEVRTDQVDHVGRLVEVFQGQRLALHLRVILGGENEGLVHE